MQVFLYITIISFIVLLAGSFYQFRFNLHTYGKEDDLGSYKVWFVAWLIFFGCAWAMIGTLRAIMMISCLMCK